MNVSKQNWDICEEESKRIMDFIGDFISDYDFDGVVLGLSGGLDSAVAATLCVKALSKKRVKALILPERDSSEEGVHHARNHAEGLGIEYTVSELTSVLKVLGCYDCAAGSLVRIGGGVKKAVSLFPGIARKGYLANLNGRGAKKFREFTAFYRMKHRLRMVSIFKEAEENKLAVVSCANRTEYETGFFVRYGDDSGDIAPLRHLYKTNVFILGEFLNIPGEILNKAPSPDLFANVSDEEIMGISYKRLDRILESLSDGLSKEEITEKLDEDPKTIRFVRDIVERSSGMRRDATSLSGRKDFKVF